MAMAENKITAQKGFTVSSEDRLALASLLIKFGYTVRIEKELVNGKTQFNVRYSE